MGIHKLMKNYKVGRDSKKFETKTTFFLNEKEISLKSLTNHRMLNIKILNHHHK